MRHAHRWFEYRVYSGDLGWCWLKTEDMVSIIMSRFERSLSVDQLLELGAGHKRPLGEGPHRQHHKQGRDPASACGAPQLKKNPGSSPARTATRLA